MGMGRAAMHSGQMAAMGGHTAYTAYPSHGYYPMRTPGVLLRLGVCRCCWEGWKGSGVMCCSLALPCCWPCILDMLTPSPPCSLAVQACRSRAATSSTAAPAGMFRHLPRQHLPPRARPVLQRRPLRRQSQLRQQSVLPARRTPSSRHPQAAAQQAMPPRAAGLAVRARRLMPRRPLPRLPRLSSERCLRAGRARGLPALTPIVQRCGPLATLGGCCPRLQAPITPG